MTSPLKTVAIADDEPQLLAVLQALVTELGYLCVGQAQDGESAVELVRRTKPHVLLLDFHMPRMNGLEATRQIAALNTTAVVIATADADPAIGLQAMDAGACGYMRKPFEVNQIAVILESAWHRFQTIGVLEAKARDLNETLELRKLTEKAKGILMQDQGFSEEQAHKTLLKLSQDQGLALKEVCRSILQVRMLLKKKSPKQAA